ncbi:MAG TPA: TolC family protein [Solimonas sp.]
MKRLLAVLLLVAGPVLADGSDPLLDGYLREALTGNPGLRARDYAQQAADADAAAAGAQRWPELTLNARYTRSEGGRTIDFPAGDLLNGVYGTLNRFLVERGEAPAFPTIENQSIALLREKEQETKLSLTAPLFAPAVWANAAAKHALFQGSVAGREAYARTLVREVKRAYYGAMQAQAAVDILTASERLLAENVRVSQSLVDAGKATRDRVLRAEAERLAVVQRLDAARAQAAQAQRLLNVLRDADDVAPVALADAGALARPAMPKAAANASTRPELRQMDAGITAREAGRRAATAALLPTLALVGDYGVQGVEYDFDSESDFSTVSLVLRWTLLDFGSRGAQRRKAGAELEQIRAERTDLERRLQLARSGAADDLATSLRAIDAAQARLQASEEGFRIAERKREVASLSQIEFLDAERALTEARLNLAIARCAALDRAAELELATATYPLPALSRAE